MNPKTTTIDSNGLMVVPGTPWGDLAISAEWSSSRYTSPVNGVGIIEAYTVGVYAASGGFIATVQLEVGCPLAHAVVWDHEDGGSKYYAPSWLVALLPPAPAKD